MYQSYIKKYINASHLICLLPVPDVVNQPQVPEVADMTPLVPDEHNLPPVEAAAQTQDEGQDQGKIFL